MFSRELMDEDGTKCPASSDLREVDWSLESISMSSLSKFHGCHEFAGVTVLSWENPDAT